jgi:hypothetical protein
VLGLVRVSKIKVLKDGLVHWRINVGDLTSALGYYGVKSKGTKSREHLKLRDWKVGFYGATMAGP